LICGVVSLGALATFIAFHLRAELVERHGAEHRDPLAEHLERNPHGALAALAPDPGITLGLIVRLSAIRASKRARGGSANDAMDRAVKRAALLPFVG
jgi:hypothetical protein